MRLRFGIIRAAALAFAYLLAPGLTDATLAAQGRCELCDDRPVTIAVKRKTRREPNKRRRIVRRRGAVEVEQAPLLSLTWRVFKMGRNGELIETNPLTVFFPGDLLRLGVRTNQDGYLYIVHQRGRDQEGRIVFPDSRINGGQNYVSKDQEFMIPSNCQMGPNMPPCALPVLPPAGQEYFTLVFSRDMLLDLPNKAAEAGGAIRPDILQEILRGSGQKLVRQPGATRYAVKMINVNTRDNEEIIATLVLNKGQQ